MAANTQKRDIKRNIRKMKQGFLEGRKSTGGDKIEFVTEVIDNVDEATKGIEVKDALKEMVAGYAASIWESKSKRNEDQLVISGLGLDPEIRFPDETAPSGYRTVLARYATIRQHRLSIAMLESERADLDAKIKDQQALNAVATRRAGGNLDALMFDVTDEKVGA